MAQFQETNPHEDNTKKHPITADEIQFLRELQHVLNTQDNMGNCDPRFWVIKETSKEISTEEDYDSRTLFYDDMPVASLEDLCDILNKMDNNYSAEMENGALILTEIDDEGEAYYVGEYTRLDSFIEYLDLDDPEGPWSEFSISYEKQISRVVPDTLFLTHQDCEDHLRKYGYNYEPNAHAYAMTAIRSPRFEKLIKMLQTIDWNTVIPEK